MRFNQVQVRVCVHCASASVCKANHDHHKKCVLHKNNIHKIEVALFAISKHCLHILHAIVNHTATNKYTNKQTKKEKTHFKLLLSFSLFWICLSVVSGYEHEYRIQSERSLWNNQKINGSKKMLLFVIFAVIIIINPKPKPKPGLRVSLIGPQQKRDCKDLCS